MVAAVLLSALLAQSGALPDKDQLGSAGIFILGLAACCVIGNQVMSAILNMRKLKGLDVSSDGRYAAKTDLADLAVDVAALRGEVVAVNNTLSNELRAIHRSLGRIEGRLGTDG